LKIVSRRPSQPYSSHTFALPGRPHERASLRQTQVLVIPSNDDLQSFPVFDQLIEAINSARRGARDLITDASVHKTEEDAERDWV